MLASQPQTPAEVRLQAAAMLIDLGRAELAKPFVKQLGSLTTDALAELPKGGGKAALFKLALTPELSPEGKQVADAAIAAFEARAKDPQRLAAAVQALNDPSLTVRSDALEDLRAAGSTGIPPVIAAFIDPARAAERPEPQGGADRAVGEFDRAAVGHARIARRRTEGRSDRHPGHVAES